VGARLYDDQWKQAPARHYIDQAGDSNYKPCAAVIEVVIAENPVPSLSSISPASTQGGALGPDVTLRSQRVPTYTTGSIVRLAS
jgi:hypothetical protein